ncbi:MAG: Rieske (2Fe-2S) protein, partial [Deltaproteobacteria bacterium]|nr:Rieske (2Fe-2S) protein [Deltaproteobacteria bacterium]
MKDAALDNLIIDDQKAGIFRVNRRAFTENEYLEREYTRVFGKCWIYAGHESEIPQSGDFRSRRVAGRSLILVRGDDGAVRVFFNTCTHRGSLVCRQPRGNARSFQCPYHAWTFNCRGDLIGVPGDSSYSEAFNRAEFALGRPRTDTYRGFIFVNFDSAATGLNDYLAGAKEYLDLVCDQSEIGMKISE